MVIHAKSKCKNNEDFFFSGKEMSPLGLGYCAYSESVGEQMVGNDGKHWVVAVKNGEKAWVRSPEKIGLEKEEPVLLKRRAEPKTEIEFDEGYEYTNENNETFVVKIVKDVKTWVKKKESKAKVKTKRGPTKYNLFIGRTLNQLRKDEPGLETIVYMQKALEVWRNLTPHEKANLT